MPNRWLKKTPSDHRATGKHKVVVDGELTFSSAKAAKVCLDALENLGFQIGADVWMLYEIGRVYECRIDASMARLAAA